MISRNLIRRIERLERQLRPRIQDMKASDIEISKESMNIEMIQRLQAGRTRMNQENELARQTAAAAAAMAESEITEA
jgi:hypothetical protein